MSVSSVSGGPAMDAWQQYLQKLKQTQAQVTTPQTASTDPTQPATNVKPHHGGHHHGGGKNTDALAALFDSTSQTATDDSAASVDSSLDILI